MATNSKSPIYAQKMKAEAAATKARKEVKVQKKQKQLLGAALVGVVAVSLLAIFSPQLNSFFLPSQPAVEVFDVQVYHLGPGGAISDDPLIPDYFTYGLYGLAPGDSADDWLNWDLIKSGTGLGNIKTTDLDTSEYRRFWLIYNATIPESRFDDGLGDRTYGEREAELYPGKNNTLYATWTPSSAGVNVFDVSFTWLNMSATNVTFPANVTVVAGTNATQTDACYVEYFSMQTYEYIRPRAIFEYNASVTTSRIMSVRDLSGGTVTAVRVNATAYAYEFSELGPDPAVFSGRWPVTSSLYYELVGVTLGFGSTTL